MTSKIKKPHRIRHSFVQRINGSRTDVFPLLCPVREVEWVPGWSPVMVLSESSVAEQDCVFITPGDPHNAIWVITRHEPDQGVVEMHKIMPGHTVTKLEISVQEAGVGASTVTVAYQYTAIGPAGEEFLKECTAEWYEKMMIAWEGQMNTYLAGE